MSRFNSIPCTIHRQWWQISQTAIRRILIRILIKTREIQCLKIKMSSSNKTSISSMTSDCKTNLDESWYRKLQCNVQRIVVVSQRVVLVIMNQFNHRRELQWLNKSKLAILVKDLNQLIASTFPVNNNVQRTNKTGTFFNVKPTYLNN